MTLTQKRFTRTNSINTIRLVDGNNFKRRKIFPKNPHKNLTKPFFQVHGYSSISRKMNKMTRDERCLSYTHNLTYTEDSRNVFAYLRSMKRQQPPLNNTKQYLKGLRKKKRKAERINPSINESCLPNSSSLHFIQYTVY